MTQAGSWPSIQRHGLLSTESLLDLFDVAEPLRTEIMTRRRANSVRLRHPVHGEAVIRDQKPLSESKLGGCLLDGLTPGEWLRILNTKVFFWVDPNRLAILRDARAYRRDRQLVLTLDTEPLVTRYSGRIILSDRNTGTTSPFAHPRGRDTFRPLDENGGRRIVELAVEGRITDVLDFVLRAEEIGGEQFDQVLYPG